MSCCVSPAELANITRRHCLAMLKAGPGIHAYVLHKVTALESEEPDTYAGLTALVEKTIGPAAVRVARRDIGILTTILPTMDRATADRLLEMIVEGWG